MGTPSRYSIVWDIQSKLANISIANGYKTDVVTIHPYLRSRDDIANGLKPYIGWGMGKETATDLLSGVIDITAPLVVVAYVVDDNWVARAQKTNDIIDDIIVALLTDPTRSENAYNTKYLGCETDECDPDAIQEGHGAAILEFEVSYERTRAAS